MRPGTSLKVFLVVLMFLLFLFSCTTGMERIEVLKKKFPNSNITTLKLHNQESWYLVTDTLTSKIYLVDFYMNKRIGEVYQIK